MFTWGFLNGQSHRVMDPAGAATSGAAGVGALGNPIGARRNQALVHGVQLTIAVRGGLKFAQFRNAATVIFG
jgi:hypothetical protein